MLHDSQGLRATQVYIGPPQPLQQLEGFQGHLLRVQGVRHLGGQKEVRRWVSNTRGEFMDL